MVPGIGNARGPGIGDIGHVGSRQKLFKDDGAFFTLVPVVKTGEGGPDFVGLEKLSRSPGVFRRRQANLPEDPEGP